MPKQFFTYEQQLNKLKNEKQLKISNPAYAGEYHYRAQQMYGSGIYACNRQHAVGVQMETVL